MSSSQRLYELDVLRGLAALGVVLFHYTTGDQGKIVGYNTEYWFNFKSGYYGVELFFIISGFVIFMTLEKITKGMDFVVSRFSRLYPVYWTSIIFTVLIFLVFKQENNQVNWQQILINLTMLQGFLDIPNLNGVYWSLTHELVFYGIMFTFYRLKVLDKIEWINLGWLGLIALISSLIQQDLLYIPGRISILLLLDHGMFFIAGISFYIIYQKGVKFPSLMILALSLLTYLIFNNHGHPQVIFFFTIFSLVVLKKMTFINHKYLISLGTISYSLYLIHDSLDNLLMNYLHYDLGINVNLAVILVISVAITLATLMTFYIEKPAMAMIKQQYSHFQNLAHSKRSN